jgi:hypothetical protein
MVSEMNQDASSEDRVLRAELSRARKDAVYGVARVAGSFANDLAEAREGLRILLDAIEVHVALHGDPTGELTRARSALRPRAFGR